MAETTKISIRAQTPGEEVANTISHGIAVVGAVVAIPVLVVAAAREGGAAAVVGATIFGSTLTLAYLASTLYHALPEGKAKRVFHILDQCSIYLLIAGTYTPFTLGALRGAWGWTLFGLVWGLAAAGIVLKAVFRARFHAISMSLYLTMGWLLLIAAEYAWHNIPRPGLLWLFVGGVAYTGGVAFYLLDSRVRYAHFVWHIFVMTGSACHFVAVLWYAG